MYHRDLNAAFSDVDWTKIIGLWQFKISNPYYWTPSRFFRLGFKGLLKDDWMLAMWEWGQRTDTCSGPDLKYRNHDYIQEVLVCCFSFCPSFYELGIHLFCALNVEISKWIQISIMLERRSHRLFKKGLQNWDNIDTEIILILLILMEQTSQRGN